MTGGKLVLDLKNTVPVELSDLTLSFTAFAKEYADYAEEEFDGRYRTDTRLYIQEIRSGSIVAELIPYAPLLLPILSDVNTLLGFAERIKKTIEWLKNPTPADEPDFTKASLENVSAFVEPVAKDGGSQINVVCNIENFAPVVVNVNSSEANAIQNQVHRQLERLKEPEVGTHRKVLMYWFQARNDTASDAGDRAIIESISTRPVKVVFISEAAKLAMLGVPENLFKSAFVVDVCVETIQSRPSLYRVLEVHDHFPRE